MSVERRAVQQPPPPPVMVDVWACDGCGTEMQEVRSVYEFPANWLIIRRAHGEIGDARLACPTCAPGVSVTINGKEIKLP